MWHFIKKYILQPLFLISFGGMAYFNFEILFRGYSHISMIICCGLCFYTIGLLNEGKNGTVFPFPNDSWKSYYYYL